MTTETTERLETPEQTAMQTFGRRLKWLGGIVTVAAGATEFANLFVIQSTEIIEVASPALLLGAAAFAGGSAIEAHRQPQNRQT
ncbi:MAG: hypothetical protein AAB436_02020 [Patescibacteria group bacterium]